IRAVLLDRITFVSFSFSLQLVKLCIGMIDAGKAYNAANKQFVSGIRELAQQSTKDEVIEYLLCLSCFLPSQILFDQAQRSIKTQLQTFVKDDLRKFKEAKKQFDKVSEEKEAALIKNAQAPRNKQHEVEEATNILTATRKCFRHIVLDYVLQINVLQSKRRSEILKSMLSFMYAHLTFFHQGYDLFSELQPLMKLLGGQLDQLVVDAAKEKRDMEQKHSTIQQKDFSNDDTKLEYNVDADNGIAMEGYLFKRASNAFKTWNRYDRHCSRWFSIQNNQLVYQKKFKDNPTVVVEDLRLCTVKHCEDIERRFCFEVVSPTKSCMMQADSEKLRQAWIKAVQNSIATAFRDKGDEGEKLDRKSSTSTGSLDSGGEPKERSLKGESALQKVLAIPGNACCCDCGQPDPRWASINLGITLCIQCSGIHRSLGVHFSKVRSLTLDTWEPELLKLMCELGNGVINQIYEARREELGARKPQPGDPRHEVEAYIKAKYVDRRFVRRPSDEELRNKVVSLSKQEKRLSSSSEHLPPRPPPPTPKLRPGSNVSGQSEAAEAPPMAMPATLPPPSPCKEMVFYEPKEYSQGLQLYWASCARSLPDMAEALAHGAEVNWVNTEDDKRTPLIMAVQGGSLVACEFLLQNAANVNQQDAQGRGPLHHATMLGHTGQVCLFLKRGANQNAADIDEKTPLTIAVEAANADIVTLLRLAKMNEEMREAEGPYSQSGDETYQDIFQDFTHMASNDPDKLNRYQQYDPQKP
uniref:Arf-GAP with coiled-coil, ANK repeat and PH domain-containing protein n=1 Tax=Sparus aurata TaxID=8175 RepID=A0A671Z3L6_SPAAU